MSIRNFLQRNRFMYSPEHGGHNVKGGRPESDPEGDGGEQISDAMGERIGGHRPASTGQGVPGSRTNPVTPGEEPQPENDAPVGRPAGEGSGAGS